MLFIFRVDIGSMINLEMNLALETVAHLQTAIASYCNIPVDKQVLLISGGESLEANERVCKYTAGSSDSNPIFLFSVSTLEGSNPPTLAEVAQERDLQPEVESSLGLPDTHNTVAVRTTLAQEYVKVSREQVRLCEREIHDQHLQHQGWAAALANLEDSVLAI
jgi:RB1-inducible coiled-coil protein 1